MTIFDYENPRLEGVNVTVPPRSGSGDLCSFELDLSADRYGAKELAMSAVSNAQLWHRRLGHLHAQPFPLANGNLIGSFTPMAIGSYKYVSKGGEYIGEEFQQYCLETGIVQEFAGTNTPHQIGVSERVRRNLCAMVRFMLADSDFPSSMWGELFMATACLKNRTPREALTMKTPFKMLHGEEADLSHLYVIRSRTFVHIKVYRKLDAAV